MDLQKKINGIRPSQHTMSRSVPKRIIINTLIMSGLGKIMDVVANNNSTKAIRYFNTTAIPSRERNEDNALPSRRPYFMQMVGDCSKCIEHQT